ncbi:MAG: sensor histidine kinase [Francisellaceae bacterium]
MLLHSIKKALPLRYGVIVFITALLCTVFQSVYIAVAISSKHQSINEINDTNRQVVDVLAQNLVARPDNELSKVSLSALIELIKHKVFATKNARAYIALDSRSHCMDLPKHQDLIVVDCETRQLDDSLWLTSRVYMKAPFSLLMMLFSFSPYLLLIIAIIYVMLALKVILPLVRFKKFVMGMGMVSLNAKSTVDNAVLSDIAVLLEDVKTQQAKRLAFKHKQLAMTLHDIRTPLTHLQMKLEMYDYKLYDQCLPYFKELDMMSKVLLANTKEEWLSYEPPVNCRIMDYLGRLFAEYRHCKEVRVEFALPGEAMIFIRPMALKRAITNIIDNALKYGKAAEIQVRIVSRRLAIVVHDSGAGIPDDKLVHLFTPFYGNGSGTGLGLAISKEIIEAHGGDIYLYNHEKGGLVVEVKLPLSNQGEEDNDE